MDWEFEKEMLKKSVCNIRMLGVILISIAVFGFELIVNQHFFAKESTAEVMQDTQSMVINLFALSIYTLILGILPGLPYAFSLMEEKNSGYMNYELLRMSPKRYIKGKILSVAVSGACTVLIPYGLVVLLLGIRGETTTVANHLTVLENLVWADILYVWNGYYVLFLKAILLVMFGIFWAELTLMLTLFLKNRYVAFVLPYVIYELLFFLGGNNNIGSLINPRFMIRYDQEIGSPLWLPYVCYLIYILLVIICIVRIFNSRKQVR